MNAALERRGHGELSTVNYRNEIIQLLKLLLNSSCAVSRAPQRMCSRALTRSARLQPGKAQRLMTLFWERNCLLEPLSPFAHMTFLKQQRWTEVTSVVV